ncbi:DUF4269 domain-containing protein [Halalkalibacillus sediminis]|uniref:DUF4269 domain-containing protein n=1 Tax=Halalkalibacillus sediminis TaxID=2018042 RepID=A0A2I0QR84_9BACI|nr:DUF4269 domain-containing protein [Halalkalibacillus sediminis]PKR76846.1 DUF4269 domain-containing protein [Halalkalibacillus sediminis]
MYNSIDYLTNGSSKQKRSFDVINELKIMSALSEFDPVLCGTIPLNIDIKDSDLDIIMEVHDFDLFGKMVLNLYSDYQDFRIKRIMIRELLVIKANFKYREFEFELFGQPKPVKKQNAYLHMIIEDFLLKERPRLKEEIIQLKESGFSTEAAFCEVLGLSGDPYEQLIVYGEERGII